VDQQYDIQIINAEAIRLLGIYTPTAGKDLLHVTQGVPIAPLRATLDAAFHRPTDMPDESATIITVQTMDGEPQHLLVACYPHRSKRERAAGADPKVPTEPDMVMVLVSNMTHLVRQQQTAAEMSARAQVEHLLAQSSGQSDIELRYRDQIEENARLRAQVAEISSLNYTLLHSNHQLVEANLDLRGANEDLLVGREEAEAGTEEIKTLNEELQATNEELVTVNEELEATIEELHTANDDLTVRSRELQRMTVSLEQQHHVSEAARTQLEAILLSMGDALMVLDPGGVATLTNAAYTRMFGHADAGVVAEDPLGHPLPPEAQPQQRAAAGSPFTMQFARTAPDGARQSFEATGQPIMNGSTTQGSVVTIRDITERRLRLVQEQFLAVASHELRSPLTSLLMALQLLAKQSLASANGLDMQTAIRLALRQGQRLRVLVNDLLDVDRVQQEKLRLELALVDLGALLAETIETVRLDTQGPTIVLDSSVEPLVVMADATRLEQIILNLLTNAIKYAPCTQRIEVRLRRVDASTGGAAEGDEAELQVKDYGPGISATDLPQIFTRYFQSPQQDSSALDGLGLGLYITKELVTAHGGSIAATSVIGEGAIFTVRLPLRGSDDSQADLGAHVRERAPSGRRRRRT
jgi:two-component system CheB/CheR fusion protein